MPNDAAPAPVTADNADNANVKVEQDWRASLPEDIRSNPTLGKIKSVDALASSYINLQSHLGRDKIVKPVTDEDWNGVYNFLGRPETAKDYKIEIAKDLPDPIKNQFNDEALNSFKEISHSLGLNEKQLQGLFGWYAQNQAGAFAQMQEKQGKSLEEGERALHAEWGRAYEQNVGFARQAFEEYGGEELAQLMETSGLGNHPAVLRTFANIAKATMADKDLAGKENQQSLILTPQEAKAEAATIMAHPAYMDRQHPEHNAMVRKVQQLFEKAYN
jgi:hypothetical protein